MSVKVGEKRGKYTKRVDSTVSNYKDMTKFNYKIHAPAEWECMACKSNSLLPMEYGCKMCQPFTEGATLKGRKYL